MNYRTTHRGIAAYLITKGFKIEKIEAGKNRNGDERTFIYFDIDAKEGSDLGNQYYDALNAVQRRLDAVER